MQTELQYTVPGMSCGSCEAAITEEVQEVSGVQAIDVDLEAKSVTVRGENVEAHAVRAAIAEAGYVFVVGNSLRLQRFESDRQAAPAAGR